MTRKTTPVPNQLVPQPSIHPSFLTQLITFSKISFYNNKKLHLQSLYMIISIITLELLETSAIYQSTANNKSTNHSYNFLICAAIAIFSNTFKQWCLSNVLTQMMTCHGLKNVKEIWATSFINPFTNKQNKSKIKISSEQNKLLSNTISHN